ncbi:MAG: hypothetical protein OXD36_00895 [Rhodobacter sp.]|nr:hypothetical protein [Rhodobacter sp.]
MKSAYAVIAWMRRNPRWHAVNIGAHRRKITTPLAELDGRELVRAHYFPMLAHAIVWSRAGAEALLARRHPVFCPADNMYRHVLTRSDRGLALYPPAAEADTFDSEITARSGGPRGKRGRTALYNWRRQKRLWTEKLIALRHQRAARA